MKLNKGKYTVFTCSLSPASARTLQRSSYLAVEKGSMFCLTVPLNRKGVCGITERCCLRECRPIFRASYPPTFKTDPASGSMRRKRVWMIEDFPAPVRPTIPILCPAFAVKVTSFNTRGSPSLYLVDRLLNSTLGFSGHSTLNSSPYAAASTSALRPISQS